MQSTLNGHNTTVTKVRGTFHDLWLPDSTGNHNTSYGLDAKQSLHKNLYNYIYPPEKVSH